MSSDLAHHDVPVTVLGSEEAPFDGEAAMQQAVGFAAEQGWGDLLTTIPGYHLIYDPQVQAGKIGEVRVWWKSANTNAVIMRWLFNANKGKVETSSNEDE